MSNVRGDYYPDDDFIDLGINDIEVRERDEDFECIVDNFDREPEINESREMRESLQP